MVPGVVPPEVLTALGALAERPRMAGEPGVCQRRNPALAATTRFRKRDNVETKTFRVGEQDLVLAVDAKAVSLMRHAAQAPGTQPVSLGRSRRGQSSAVQLRLRRYRRNRLLLPWAFPVHV